MYTRIISVIATSPLITIPLVYSPPPVLFPRSLPPCQGSGKQVWSSMEMCCAARTGAFAEGCSQM